MPGLDTFRAPARYVLLFHLALSAIAAVVFEDIVGVLRRGERIPVRHMWPLAIPAVIAFLIAWWLRDFAGRGLLFALGWAAATALVTVLLAAVAAILAFCLFRRRENAEVPIEAEGWMLTCSRSEDALCIMRAKS